MKVALDYYSLVRAAILGASLTLAVLSLMGVHPVFAGDPIGGTGPH
jgi:hypothetical protein